MSSQEIKETQKKILFNAIQEMQALSIEVANQEEYKMVERLGKDIKKLSKLHNDIN